MNKKTKPAPKSRGSKAAEKAQKRGKKPASPSPQPKEGKQPQKLFSELSDSVKRMARLSAAIAEKAGVAAGYEGTPDRYGHSSKPRRDEEGPGEGAGAADRTWYNPRGHDPSATGPLAALGKAGGPVAGVAGLLAKFPKALPLSRLVFNPTIYVGEGVSVAEVVRKVGELFVEALDLQERDREERAASREREAENIPLWRRGQASQWPDFGGGDGQAAALPWWVAGRDGEDGQDERSLLGLPAYGDEEPEFGAEPEGIANWMSQLADWVFAGAGEAEAAAGDDNETNTPAASGETRIGPATKDQARGDQRPISLERVLNDAQSPGESAFQVAFAAHEGLNSAFTGDLAKMNPQVKQAMEAAQKDIGAWEANNGKPMTPEEQNAVFAKACADISNR